MSKPAENFSLSPSPSSAANKIDVESKLEKLSLMELAEALKKATKELNEATKQLETITSATNESLKLSSDRAIQLTRKYAAKKSELTNITSRYQRTMAAKGDINVIPIIQSNLQLLEEELNDRINESDYLHSFNKEVVFHYEQAKQQQNEALEKVQQLHKLLGARLKENIQNAVLLEQIKVRELREKALRELKSLTEEIQRKSKATSSKPNTKSSEEAYIDELEDFVQHQNPKPHAEIDYVWVLSARHTFLRRPVDAANLKDSGDDLNRVLFATAVAKGVTMARTHKTPSSLTKEDYLLYGPIIIYNGTPLHNFDLGLESLGDGTIIGYPFEKFTILPLDPDKIHTGGQFLSVKNAKLPMRNNAAFALVTHAYHFPRVSRMIDHPSQKCIEQGRCYAFLVDRTLEAPGALQDVRGEVLFRSTEYIKKGFIAKEPSRRIINKPLDQIFQSAAGDLAFKEPEHRAKSELLFSYSYHQNTKQFVKSSDPALRPIEIIREYLGGYPISVQNTETKKMHRRNSFG